MAHALREVWRRRSGRTLTEAAYEAIGGVRGAVAHTAEEVYGRLSETETETARTLLLRMVAPGAGTQDTRRPVDRAELPPGCAPVLEQLVAARLLTVDEGVVDLAHEALITAWPRLRGWIEEDRERLRLHRALTEAAYTWQELGRDPGVLYRGARLTAATEAFVANQRDGELTAGEEEFLMAGIDAHAQGVRTATRAARRTRALLSGLVALLCLAMVAGTVAWQQNENADRRSTEAQARRIAGVARTLRLSDPVTATRLSVAAWRLADLPETREAVRGAAAQRERDMFAGGDRSERAAHFLSGDEPGPDQLHRPPGDTVGGAGAASARYVRPARPVRPGRLRHGCQRRREVRRPGHRAGRPGLGPAARASGGAAHARRPFGGHGRRVRAQWADARPSAGDAGRGPGLGRATAPARDDGPERGDEQQPLLRHEPRRPSPRGLFRGRRSAGPA